MKLDSAFQIGKTHDVCQDFALVGDKEDTVPYVMVSDGCSSSPLTDVGSRILSFAAIEQVESKVNMTGRIKDFNHEVCVSKARNIAQSMGITERSIDATLLLAVVTDRVEVNVLGDGVIAVGLDNEEVLIINIEYDKGYPFYLSYLPECSNSFKKWRKNYWKTTIKSSLITPSLFTASGESEYTEVEGQDAFFLEEDDKPSIYMLQGDWNVKVFIELNNVKWVTIMSDGINSFYKTENTGTSLTNKDISYQEVISQVLGFKNFNGQFMQRRLNRFLKFCTKNNWHHADDISFGAIYFE